MISFAGNLILVSALVFSLIAIISAGRTQLVCFYIASILPMTSLGLLIYAFSICDFKIKNVFFNSSTLMPTIYKVSACWTSHEGSTLLWYSLLSIASFIYIYIAQFSINLRKPGVIILSLVQILFCTFIIFTSNPFDIMSFTPQEGLGLNPMLQDIALSIHPPLLYIGFVSYIGPFTGGILLLYQNQKQRSWSNIKQVLQITKIFLNFGLTTLTIGIGLGSWWAYRELGWGGYWFFDPVENISLIPWISALTLHHFLITSIKQKKYIYWTIFLSLLCFMLTLYGTFIVRSGMISSVHAFAFSPQRGLYLFAICIILTVISFGSFFLKQSSITLPSQKYNTKDHAILFSNILWMTTQIILIIALIYPIYYSCIYGVDLVIDPDYFKTVYIPLHIPILFFAAITPLILKRNYIKKILICIISLVTAYSLISWLNLSLITSIFCFTSIYLITHSCNDLIQESSFFSRNISIKSYAVFFGHCGFGLLALSVALNTSLSREIGFIGKIGTEIKKDGVIVKLEDIKYTDNKVYLRQIAVFSIMSSDNKITVLKPENRLYKIENTLSQEVDIYSYLFHDIYAVLSQVDQYNIVHATIYYQPCINFIWLSVVLISFGFLLSFYHSKRIKSSRVKSKD